MVKKRPTIRIKPENKGKLRKKMGTPKNKSIPVAAMRKRLAAAKKSGNTALVKQLTFALNARKWGK